MSDLSFHELLYRSPSLVVERRAARRRAIRRAMGLSNLSLCDDGLMTYDGVGSGSEAKLYPAALRALALDMLRLRAAMLIADDVGRDWPLPVGPRRTGSPSAPAWVHALEEVEIETRCRWEPWYDRRDQRPEWGAVRYVEDTLRADWKRAMATYAEACDAAYELMWGCPGRLISRLGALSEELADIGMRVAMTRYNPEKRAAWAQWAAPSREDW